MNGNKSLMLGLDPRIKTSGDVAVIDQGPRRTTRVYIPPSSFIVQ